MTGRIALPTALKPLPRGSFDYWKAQHLLNRAGFGGTPSQVRALTNLGLDDAVDYILDFEDVDFPSVSSDTFDNGIMRSASQEERMGMRSARQNGDEATLEQYRRERQARQRSDRQQMAQVQRWWLKRMIETPRPLEEKMTLFWHGHFATGYRTIEDSYHMFLQNQLFRANALGNFKGLTHAIVHDPAMLRYLNNNQNNRQQPNENLARELMELFTLGEGHEYTEDDIKEGARALTGYSFRDDEFAYYSNNHDPGLKLILGQRGHWDGDDFVDIIFTRRAVSEYMSLKLYRFFVHDLPEEDIPRDVQTFVTSMGAYFRDKDYEIKPLLKALFRSQHFYSSVNQNAQIKSPVQIVVQSLRSLRVPARDLSSLLFALDLMGQNIGYPPSVKGWDGGRSWINTATLFVRQNLMVYMLTGREASGYPWQGDSSRYDPMHLVEHLRQEGRPIDPRDAVMYLLRFNLGGEPRPERVETLLTFVRQSGNQINAPVVTGILSLITAMPEFQLC